VAGTPHAVAFIRIFVKRKLLAFRNREGKGKEYE
jgi:hypothetical protein